MGSLELEGFTYTDVDSAREEIYVQLKHVGNRKVIYFDGWHGFGASAVLRSIATMLPSRRATPELCFDRIIYIDFSKWKNRRAVQRIIVEELKLDPFVMAILNEQDEEDDFNKVDESSRNEIDRVGQVIAQTLRDSKFMLIFLNGSDGEVDIGAFGIPLTRWGNSVMIWTFDRCCLTLHGDHSGVADKLRYTHLFFHYRRQYFMPMKKLTGREFHGLLQQHAVTIVDRNPCMVDIDPAMVANCCLYELLLHFNFHATTKFDWIAHASNYWICDGIIQQDIARDIANALRREINWECDHFLVEELLTSFTEDSVYEDHSKKHFKPSFVVMKDHVLYEKEPYCWISITPNPSRDTVYNKITRSPIKGGRKYLPAEASSFFLASGTSDHSRSLRNGLFKQSTKLGVLILYCCAFNFASPPFLKCRSLRFLGIDHCTDGKAIKGEDHTEWLCLYSLWVLDLRHTDWREILSQEKIGLMANIRELNIVGVRGWQYTSHLQCRLPNLLRLRIIKPTCQWETPEDVDNSLTYETRMEILDLSGNTDMKNLPTSLQKASSLVLLVLDGCDQLETVERIPHSLESFSFDGHGSASQWTHNVKLPPKQFDVSTTTDNMDIRVSKISLEGCTHLDNLFLRGLPNLVELDLSGTAVKILDFKTMVVQVPMLKRLYLIGCKHLRAIIAVYNMYTKIKPGLELLCIDTRAGIVCPRPSINKTRSFRLQVHVIVVDTRLTRSFTDMLPPYTHGDTPKDVYYNIHVTGSPRHDEVVQFEATGKEDKIGPCDQESLQQLIPAGQYSDVLSMVCDLPKQAFPQPPTTKLDRHIEIAERSCNMESELDGRLGKLMGFYTESLHVHDVMLRDIVPHVDYWWNELRWFRVERCPKVDTVFHTYYYGFAMLETLWVSDLLMARWIWPKLPRRDNCWLVSFGNLQHLHLRSCPTLKFVIPVWVSSFPNLETLHIIHCGDLSHVFVLDEKHEQEVITHGVLFPKLKTVHLHDLPKLNKICEVKMVAPALESIKIRGCSGLRRLPSVGDRARGTNNPTVEIEKDVWDALEWDADHRPDHFEAPVHSRYYKKKLPRVSVLR